MDHDPIEDDPKHAQIFEEVVREIKASMRREGLPDEPAFLGWCHMYWGYKKQILRDKYGIDWKSPAELNPGTIYD